MIQVHTGKLHYCEIGQSKSEPWPGQEMHENAWMTDPYEASGFHLLVCIASGSTNQVIAVKAINSYLVWLQLILSNSGFFFKSHLPFCLKVEFKYHLPFV